jgi:serine/threonine protein kinase
MELLEGCSLAQELELRGKVPFEEAVAIARPIIDALSAAHAVGVIHRDIKPSNIFLCSDREGRLVPKLLDFGIAKCPQDDFDTQTGLVLGTPGYMAPEQALLGECSVASDVWGLGAVLHHCVSGHPPHASDSMAELLRKLVREPVPPLVGLDLSKPARATIDRALMRDPHRRYATMRAFGQALAAALNHQSADATHTEARKDDTQIELVAERESQPTLPPRRFPQQVALIAAAVLVLLLLAWTLEPHGARDVPPLAHAAAQTASSDVQQRNAELDPMPVFMTATSQSRSSLAEPEPAAPVEPAPIVQPAKRPARHAARRVAHAASTPASAAPNNGASKSFAEPEATTGLPVATEW